MKKLRVTPSRLFFALYVLIGAATFRHSAIGFASLEGSMVWGALSALAVDVLMILFAHAIREDGVRFSWESAGLIFGLSVPAAASIYTQLLFAVTEAQVLQVAPGALWMGDTATNITNIRVVGLPALLPILALVAALAGKHDEVQTVSAEEHAATLAQLENVRRQAADLRKNAQANNVDLEKIRQENDELAEFRQAVTDPAAWKDATAATRLITTKIFPNGSRPQTKVMAQLFGVGDATVNAAIRSAVNKEGVAKE